MVVFGFCVWWGLFGVFRLLFPFEAFQAFAELPAGKPFNRLKSGNDRQRPEIDRHRHK